MTKAFRLAYLMSQWNAPPEIDQFTVAADVVGESDHVTIAMRKCCCIEKAKIDISIPDEKVHPLLDELAGSVVQMHAKERGLSSKTLNNAHDDFVSRIAKHARRDQ